MVTGGAATISAFLQVGPGYVEPAVKKAKKEGSEKARGMVWECLIVV